LYVPSPYTKEATVYIPKTIAQITSNAWESHGDTCIQIHTTDRAVLPVRFHLPRLETHETPNITHTPTIITTTTCLGMPCKARFDIYRMTVLYHTPNHPSANAISSNLGARYVVIPITVTVTVSASRRGVVADTDFGPVRQL
jgi:hypothetical protein